MAVEPCPVCGAPLSRLVTRAKISVGERVHCEQCMVRLGFGPRVLLFWLPLVFLFLFAVLRFLNAEPIVLEPGNFPRATCKAERSPLAT